MTDPMTDPMTPTEVDALEDQIEGGLLATINEPRLIARIRQLEAENARLRDELTEAEAEVRKWTQASTFTPEYVDRLRELAEVAREVLYWIGNMPSREAVIAGALTEHNQIYSTDKKWHEMSGESQRHWLDHVGPAVRAAFLREMELTVPPGHPLQRLRGLSAALDEEET